MRLSTILLLMSWIPLIQLLLLCFNSDRVWEINVYTFLPVSILLSITGMWLLIKKLRKKVVLYKSIINFILLLLFSIILFGIPVFTCIIKLFKINSYIFYNPHREAGLILCIISAAISCAALLLAWREAQKEEKPYLPVLNLFWHLFL